MIGQQGFLINKHLSSLFTGVSFACFSMYPHFSFLSIFWMRPQRCIPLCASAPWEHCFLLPSGAFASADPCRASLCHCPVTSTLSSWVIASIFWAVCLLPRFYSFSLAEDGFYLLAEKGCRVGTFFFETLQSEDGLFYPQRIEKFIWIYISRSDILFLHTFGGTFLASCKKAQFHSYLKFHFTLDFCSRKFSNFISGFKHSWQCALSFLNLCLILMHFPFLHFCWRLLFNGCFLSLHQNSALSCDSSLTGWENYFLDRAYKSVVYSLAISMSLSRKFSQVHFLIPCSDLP